ncbi:MAG: hypothetical protein AB8B64_27280 [Granulosicoccus sp.]
MVGRKREGTPLVEISTESIAGLQSSPSDHHFNYDADPHGRQCPVSSHKRRSNPRPGDFPPGVTGFWSPLIRILGFGRRNEYEDTIASSRFHRILRRGRTYGMSDANPGSMKETESQPCGLQFICLAGNIVRQFEFMQSAWCNSSAYAGLNEQRDPLIAHRKPRLDGSATDSFIHPDDDSAPEKTLNLPQFVTIRGDAYFFRV